MRVVVGKKQESLFLRALFLMPPSPRYGDRAGVDMVEALSMHLSRGRSCPRLLALELCSSPLQR